MSENTETKTLKDLGVKYQSLIDRYLSNLLEITTMLKQLDNFKDTIEEGHFNKTRAVLCAKTALKANDMLGEILKETVGTLDGIHMTNTLNAVALGNLDAVDFANKTMKDIKEGIPLYIAAIERLEAEGPELHKILDIGNYTFNALIQLKESFNLLYIDTVTIAL